MAIAEQRRPGLERRLSGILWDMFSGSAPYSDIFRRMLHPAFMGHFTWAIAASTWPSHRGRRREAPQT
jgi:hypothetical protein